MRSLLQRLSIAGDADYHAPTEPERALIAHEETLAALMSRDPVEIDKAVDRHLRILEDLWEAEAGRLQREQDPKSPFVFTSERGAPFTTAGFARMVERAGVEAELGFKAHPHMLRHACGYALANKGHDTRALQAYLGHKNIQHTVRYTELSPARFKDFWRT